ncbi:SCO family protein [Pontibacter mangrovi]|uniref:SCO family protein n=1 Tax=Pontibacter mangrovi TaxID=2589816 RepID=A0A501W3N7_9BACT|nr:SCO family protein [Pontibacter mangrovi]TPE43372.1 SCO family protein [Pontibacter mangrovi]
MKSLFCLSFILALALSGCKQPQPADAHASHQAMAPTATAVATNQPLSDMSLYNLSSEWQNQNGEPLTLPQLQGKVQLMAMIYTSCTYACPRIVADLRRIEESLDKYETGDVGIVLVTMDPENDTPEKLKAFAQENKLNPDRWTLLTSSEANIQELAVLLNMKYKNSGNGQIAHSNIISVLNAQGEIMHQQQGLGTDPDETVKSIEALLQAL